MDLAYACFRPFEASHLTNAVLSSPSLTLFYDPGNGVHNSWLAAPPRHPFLRFVIDGLPESANATHPLDATGPRFLARRYATWRKATRNNASARDLVRLLPSAERAGVFTLRRHLHRLWCGNGTNEARITLCAKELGRNYSVVTFWSGTWIRDYYSNCSRRNNGSRSPCRPKNVRGDLLEL